jgi:hypothetical protein
LITTLKGTQMKNQEEYDDDDSRVKAKVMEKEE